MHFICQYCGKDDSRWSLRRFRNTKRPSNQVCEDCQHKLNVEAFIEDYHKRQNAINIVEKVEKQLQDARARNIAKQKAHKRRALLNDADGNHSAEYLEYLLHKQKYKCVACLVDINKLFHVDHIYALSKGGGNGEDNIQLLCQSCNCTKNAQDPIEFLYKYKLRTYCEI